jgi:6-pyruvoyl-tetrahydropterin synthase related domain
MGACIIAQLHDSRAPTLQLGSRIFASLHFHEHRMTALSDTPTSGVLATSRRSWWLALAVSSFTALLIVSPFFWLGTASGHDFGFHSASWLDAAGQWKEGILYPRWTEWANHGFGEPRFIFYPPFSWFLGAVLSFIVPWNAVPGVFIFLVQTLAGLSAFALARRLLPQPAALLGAACYAANPYALLVVYMRSDFAEQLAAAFFPLLFLFALQLAGILENRFRSSLRAVACFSLVFSAVWLSNAPAGVMASYSVALLFFWAALTQRSALPLTRGAAGLSLGFGLCSFYLLPAAYEQSWVNISQALSSGLQPSQNFLYVVINDPEHNLFNAIASTTAILLMVFTAVALLLARSKSSAPNTREEQLWRVMLVLAAASTLLMLRPTALLWAVLPKLRFVQFPWRWMSILAVIYAYFAAASLARARPRWIWIATLAMVPLATGTFYVEHTWWDSEDIPSLRAAVAGGAGFEGTDEYDPLGDDHTNIPDKSPAAQVLSIDDQKPLNAKVELDRWTAEEKILHISTPTAALLALRLLNYPAWRVEVNGKTVLPQRLDEINEIVVSVPPGDSRVRVHFIQTPDRRVGVFIALASLFVLAFILARSSFGSS